MVYNYVGALNTVWDDVGKGVWMSYNVGKCAYI